MAGVIIFLDKPMIPDNTTEIHFFEDDVELIRFSTAHIDRKHLVRAVNGECWHRTPGPATKAMLVFAACFVDTREWRQETRDVLQAFIAEWPEPTYAVDLTPEQPASVRTMKCNLCGEPVLISDDAQLFHAHEVANHEAELSYRDIMKILKALTFNLD